MARPKKIATEPKAVVATEDSPAKIKFRAFMEDYKAKKPEKYAIKEAEFIKQLNQL